SRGATSFSGDSALSFPCALTGRPAKGTTSKPTRVRTRAPAARVSMTGTSRRTPETSCLNGTVSAAQPQGLAVGRMQKARWLAPPGFSTIPAITDSRGRSHYHGPRMLNGRVRNGNGCGHPGLLTGKLLGVGGPAPDAGYSNW